MLLPAARPRAPVGPALLRAAGGGAAARPAWPPARAPAAAAKQQRRASSTESPASAAPSLSWTAHRQTLNEAVFVACEGNDAGEIMRAIEGTLSAGFSPSREHWYAAIRGLGRLGYTAPMGRVAGLARRNGTLFTQSVLNAMLFAYAKRLDAPNVHAIAAELENIDVPLSDEVFKRLVLAYFCVGADDRAFKILDMYRASGGPVEELLEFTLNNVGALASQSANVAAPGSAPPLPREVRSAVSVRVVRKLIAYLSLSPSPAPGAVATLLNNLVFNTKRPLIIEALAHRRLVELAPPQLLERAAVALARWANMGPMASHRHNGHIKLTLHEFASGTPVTSELLDARQRELRYVVDPDWDAWAARQQPTVGPVGTGGAPAPLKGGASGGEQELEWEAEADGASALLDGAVALSAPQPHSEPELSAAGAALTQAALPQQGSPDGALGGGGGGAHDGSSPVGLEQAAPPRVGAAQDVPGCLDFDLRGMTTDLMLGNVKRRVDVRAATVTAAAVTAASGSAAAGEEAGAGLLEVLSNAPTTISPGSNPRDAQAIRAAGGQYVGPLLGALDPSAPFTSWRSDVSLQPDERSDRILRFVCGLVLHLEALDFELSDCTYRTLFAALAVHRKSVAAAQVALRLEARGATLSDSFALDRLLESLRGGSRSTTAADGSQQLCSRLVGALLPPPLLAAYRAFTAYSLQHRPALQAAALSTLPAAASPPPTASAATLAADAAVRALDHLGLPPPVFPAASAAANAAVKAAVNVQSAWQRSGYPVLHVSAVHLAEEDRWHFGSSLRSGLAFWDPAAEVHPAKSVVRRRGGGGGSSGGGGGGSQLDAAGGAQHGGATTERSQQPRSSPTHTADNPQRWYVGAPPKSHPRFEVLPPHAPQPPFGDVLPGTSSETAAVQLAQRRARDAALRAAAAATLAPERLGGSDGGADAPAAGRASAAALPPNQPEALIIWERWVKRSSRSTRAYPVQRPPYLHWLPMPPGWVAAVEDAAPGAEAAVDALEARLGDSEGGDDSEAGGGAGGGGDRDGGVAGGAGAAALPAGATDVENAEASWLGASGATLERDGGGGGSEDEDDDESDLAGLRPLAPVGQEDSELRVRSPGPELQ